MKLHLAELSNLLLTIPFIHALFKPRYNIDFIYDTSVMLFIAEFLSIHSSGMLGGVSNKNIKAKIALFFFYILFVVMLLATTKSPQLFYFLTVSFITKFFIHRNTSATEAFVKPFLVLLGTTFFVIFASSIIKIIIPIPDYVLMQKPSNISGLFVEVPQTILVWGIIYPIGLYLISFIDIPIEKSS